MKYLFLTFILFIFALSSFSQQDSIVFSNTKWQTQTIAPGIVWKHHHFIKDLFNSNQNINIVEIKLKKKRAIALACEAKTLKPTSEFGKQTGAIVAINGNFFDIKNGGSVYYIKQNDSVISNNRLWPNNIRARHQQAALVIKKGKLRIAKWDSSANWELTLNAANVMNTGPLLLWQGNRQPLDTGEFNHARHPRTAIACLGKKRVLFITVDGRNEQAAGMSLYELASIIKWLKAHDGVNMDGGGSTTMYINNQPDNGVVNYPTDNKKWDHGGERKVANVVIVK
ncbi:phosphodiester glycosidase family protein [Niastella sp. OAS944]|uniref:phosphodiester glycosidase family protein n=1 Tax=Niastella sp. OAS944 TaxID=2664089 RepID=UPI0034912041|nr:exopolysaccharide biosynthesis protein [Chitinophagaceae bacterium OAS944]